MAIMYPEVFPRSHNTGDPEFEVYQLLEKLPDHYVVFYSKRLRGGLFGKSECEIDFIITNQTDVIICLEVKGGVLEYDGAADAWTQNGKRMDVGPDLQALRACHALIGLLSKETAKVNVDWALCFPQCCHSGLESSLAVDPEQIMDEQAVLDIKNAIARLENHIRTKFKKPGVNSHEFTKIVNILTRNIGFVQILGVRIAREAKQLVQITDEQCEALCDIELNPRMIVHGCAGTGKTILAQVLAKRLARLNKDVLLLFFNKSIATVVRRAFNRDGRVEVCTFSSMAKRLVEKSDPQWWDAHKERNDDFWRIELPSRLFDLDHEIVPKFDAIIVDEGQDFKPEWYEFLQHLLVNPDQSHFTVFLDEHQDIFRHWKNFPCKPAPARK
ncbi:NERD domain-containing protein/DEAD/DEAH box helicase, partial [bacterium]|nr:NERD domain-containing protein/DEAD/DEAH box helicase [bacterium]